MQYLPTLLFAIAAVAISSVQASEKKPFSDKPEYQVMVDGAAPVGEECYRQGAGEDKMTPPTKQREEDELNRIVKVMQDGKINLLYLNTKNCKTAYANYKSQPTSDTKCSIHNCVAKEGGKVTSSVEAHDIPCAKEMFFACHTSMAGNKEMTHILYNLIGADDITRITKREVLEKRVAVLC